MPVAATVDDAQARAALREVAARLAALIRSVGNPDAHAVGEWSAREVALHLAHAWEVLPALAAGRTESPIRDVGALASLTTSLVAAEGGADVETAADRIERAAAAYLAAAPDGGELRPWLVEGVTAAPSAFSCHLLSESLVHGDDIARSQSRPWSIAEAHAAMALTGFVFPVLAAMDPRALVVEEKVRGLQACYDMRVRGGGRVYFVFNDGAVTVEPPSSRRVDCHVSARASSLLLIVFSRRSQWPAVVTGRLLAWGRRPWLGPRLNSLVRSP